MDMLKTYDALRIERLLSFHVPSILDCLKGIEKGIVASNKLKGRELDLMELALKQSSMILDGSTQGWESNPS